MTGHQNRTVLPSGKFRSLTLLLCLAVLGDGGGTAIAKHATPNAQQLFAQGYELLKAKNFSRAIKDFKLGLAHDPNNALAHFYLGTAYVGANDGRNAEVEMQKSLQLNLPEPQASEARSALQLPSQPDQTSSSPELGSTAESVNTPQTPQSGKVAYVDITCNVSVTSNHSGTNRMQTENFVLVNNRFYRGSFDTNTKTVFPYQDLNANISSDTISWSNDKVTTEQRTYNTKTKTSQDSGKLDRVSLTLSETSGNIYRNSDPDIGTDDRTLDGTGACSFVKGTGSVQIPAPQF